MSCAGLTFGKPGLVMKGMDFFFPLPVCGWRKNLCWKPLNWWEIPFIILRASTDTHTDLPEGINRIFSYFDWVYPNPLRIFAVSSWGGEVFIPQKNPFPALVCPNVFVGHLRCHLVLVQHLLEHQSQPFIFFWFSVVSLCSCSAL